MPRNDSLNYAKWDHIGDDDESSEGEDPIRQPRVTKLEEPSTITTAADGSIITIGRANQTQPPSQKEITSTEEASSRTETTRAPAAAIKPDLRSQRRAKGRGGVPASWTEKGTFIDHSTSEGHKSTKLSDQNDNDGGDDDDNDDNTTAVIRRLSYYWSQDRLTVNVRILLEYDDHHHRDVRKPQQQRWDCTVENILPYRDRQAAVMGSSSPQRLVVTCDGNILLQGHLSHPVYLADEEDTVDWSIEQYDSNDDDGDKAVHCRYLLVTLYKATPFAGMAIWWKKVLQEEDQEIALDWVKSNSAFQEAWEEAHEQFRANLENKTQRIVE